MTLRMPPLVSWRLRSDRTSSLTAIHTKLGSAIQLPFTYSPKAGFTDPFIT